MKRIIGAVCTLCAGFLTVSAQEEKGFQVKIQVEEPQVGNILVAERVPEQDNWFVDTLYLKKGRTVYRGKVKDPRLTTFIFRMQRPGILWEILPCSWIMPI